MEPQTTNAGSTIRSRINFPPATMERFAEAVLVAGGSEPREAAQVAAHLVDSDRAGHPSHGVGLLPMYVDHRLRNEVRPNASTVLVGAGGTVATFDGQGGYGRPAAEIAMEAAISGARQNGLAAVALRNVHHLGRIGAFGEMAATEGLIAIQFVSVQRLAPMVAPHGGIEPRLSTNPICVAIPRTGGEPILVDISTSAIANNKVRVAAAEGRELPGGSVIDHQGHTTTDPMAMLSEPRGAILPLGGHKGYGLALACELLAGVLTGIGSVVDQPITNGICNNMLTLCLDPQRFDGAGRMEVDIDNLLGYVLSATAINPDDPVLYPGLPEARARATALGAGIPLAPDTIAAMAAAAERIGVGKGLISELLG